MRKVEGDRLESGLSSRERAWDEVKGRAGRGSPGMTMHPGLCFDEAGGGCYTAAGVSESEDEGVCESGDRGWVESLGSGWEQMGQGALPQIQRCMVPGCGSSCGLTCT